VVCARLDHGCPCRSMNMNMKRFGWLWCVVVTSACPSAPDCVPSTSFNLEEGEVTGPLMRPGTNCIRCHSSGGEAASKPFSFGGTVYPTADAALCDGVSGVIFRITDSVGTTVSVTSNAVGNFYSVAPLEPPLQVEAEYEGRIAVMPVTTPTRGCALCHSSPDATGGAQGRIRAP
jgi:hypothetical protein